MASGIFALQKLTLQQALAENTSLNALILPVQLLNVMMTQILQSVQNFKNFIIYLYFVSQPDIRPTSGRSMVPEIPHNKGNYGGFSKLSFQLRFLHCAIEMTLIVC